MLRFLGACVGVSLWAVLTACDPSAGLSAYDDLGGTQRGASAAPDEGPATGCEQTIAPGEPGVLDCDGTCVPASWLGDGRCDASGLANLACEAHGYDGGDCAEDVGPPPEAPGSGSTAGADEADGGCEQSLEPGEPGVLDCDGTCAPASWIGDGYCDDGRDGVNFFCDTHQQDGGDCDSVDDAGGGDGSTTGSGGMAGSAGTGTDAGTDGTGAGTDGTGAGTDGTGAGTDGTNAGTGSSGDATGAGLPPGASGCDANGQAGVLDCDGSCVPALWLGDGYCDDGTGQGGNLMCPQLNNDMGDCGTNTGGTTGGTTGGDTNTGGTTGGTAGAPPPGGQPGEPPPPATDTGGSPPPGTDEGFGGTGSTGSGSTGNNPCGAGELLDCTGWFCVPASWLGDGTCDDALIGDLTCYPEETADCTW